MNKIFRIVLIIAIIGNMFGAIANAEGTNVPDTAYQEAVNVLTALKILEDPSDGEFKADEDITRAEMADIITRLLGVSKVTDAGSLPFSDVTEDNKYYSNICTVYKMGIISGYGDGRFGPDDSVTYQQALKFLVMTLGYDVYAKNKGGYPMGYMAVAVEKGITKNVNYNEKETVSRAVAAQLVYNSLNVEMMMQDSYSTAATYSSSKDKTLLTERLGLKKKKGIVTAIGVSRLNEIGQSSNEDEIEIDRIVYKKSEVSCDGLLGYSVVFYYTTSTETDDKTIVYITKDAHQNNAIILDPKYISIDDSRNTTINYQKDKKETYHLVQNAKILYNGVFIGTPSSINKDDLVPVQGNVVIIDNNNDGTFEYVMISAVKNFIVDRVALYNNQVSFKYGNQLDQKTDMILDEKDTSYAFKILFDDKPITLGDLKEWDVISVLQSQNSIGKKLITIYVSRNTVEGKIEEIVNSGDDKEVLIEGKSYKIADNYLAAVNSERFDAKNITLNMEGTFYLSKDGYIAGVDTSKSTMIKTGYLISAGVKSGIESTAQIKIYTSDGKVKIFDCETNMEYYDTQNQNGINLKSGAVVDKLKVTDVNGGKTTDNQLLMYKVNDNDKITEVYKALVNSSVPGILNYKLTLDYTYSHNPNVSKELGRYYAGLLGSRYKITADAPIFNIPDDRRDEDGYSITKVGSFGFDRYLDSIVLFNIDEYYTAHAGIMYGGGGTITYDKSVAILDRSTNIVNEKGENKLSLYCWIGGSLTQKIAYSEDVTCTAQNWYPNTKISDLKKGDVFQFSVNSNDEINNIRVVFRPSVPGTYRLKGYDSALEYPAASQMIHTAFQMAYGKVVRIGNNMLITNTWGDGTVVDNQTSSLLGSVAKYYIYDTAINKILPASADDIVEGDNVFIHKRFTPVQEVMIIR